MFFARRVPLTWTYHNVLFLMLNISMIVFYLFCTYTFHFPMCDTPMYGPQQTLDIASLLVQCWADVVAGGPTLKEHWFNLSFLLCGSCWRTIVYYNHPANTRRLPDVILMLVQRWRRWTNIQITLVPCLVSTDCFTSTQSLYSDHTEHDMLVQCWPNIGPASKTVDQL